MSKPRIITLTTDFGDQDSYVGQMKGAILAVHPAAVIVDVTHQVPPGNVAVGAFVLETAYNAFPSGSIHVAIVDPGVGTARRPLVVRTEDHLFVAPDNGVLSRALSRSPARGAWLLEASHYRRPEVSATFEGRDVFAPAAAWLARGIEPANFGPSVREIARIARPAPSLAAGRPTIVSVALVDRFGNVVVDISRAELAPWCDPTTGLFRGTVIASAQKITESRRTYGDGPPGTPFVLFGSLGYLEIAMRDRSAAESLRLDVGSDVQVVPAVL